MGFFETHLACFSQDLHDNLSHVSIAVSSLLKTIHQRYDQYFSDMGDGRYFVQGQKRQTTQMACFTKQFPALHSTHAQKGGVESQECKIDRGASNIPFNTVIMHGHKAEIGACTY